MERKGSFIQTFNGGRFFPMDPRVEEVNIYDIAHALALTNRFGGHTPVPYSVADHSVLVSRMCDRRDAIWGLLHDASEAYILDVPRPIKKDLVGYAEIEARVQSVICKRFGLSLYMPGTVDLADRRALATERRDLMPSNHDWGPMAEPYEGRIAPLGWEESERAFLQRFGYLMSL